jgi:hypothetical protein
MRRKDARVKREIPIVKIRFLPVISEYLPKGTRNTAAARRYAVATQLRETASIANSFPIVGRATFTDEPSNGVMKPASTAIARTILWSMAGKGEAVCPPESVPMGSCRRNSFR